MSGSGFTPIEISDGDACLSFQLPPLADFENLKPDTGRAAEAEDVYLKVVDAIKDDDPDEFAMWMRSPALGDLQPPHEVSDFGVHIMLESAVECAEVVLSRRTEKVLGPHLGFSPDGWTALHDAAVYLHQPMLEALLHSGYFDPDLRADMPKTRCKFPIKQVLPLNVGLRSFRIAVSGNPEPSVFTLLNYFYTRRDSALDGLRMLALNTREFLLHQEFLNYAKQGKMVELAALLMAAGDKLLPLRISEGQDAPVFNSFKEISRFLQDQNGWLLTNDDEYAEWKETLKLLDIYDKICNQLTSYVGLKTCRRSGMEVASLLQAQGFDVVTGFDNLYNYIHNYVPVERSKASQSGMEKAEGFDVRIDDNNLPHYVHVDRSNDSSFKSRAPHINGEFGILFPEVNMYSSNWTNQESKQPSMPIGLASYTSSTRNMSTKSGPSTPPIKSLKAVQNFMSNKRLWTFTRMLTRGVRYV